MTTLKYHAPLCIYIDLFQICKSKISHTVELFNLKNHEKLYLIFEEI